MEKITKNQVINILKQCYDPEIPIDLWQLGLIYDIQIINNSDNHYSNIKILMSLTTPGCGMSQQMTADIKKKLEQHAGVKQAQVTITFDPPWNPSMISPAAQKKLEKKIIRGLPKQSCYKNGEEIWE